MIRTIAGMEIADIWHLTPAEMEAMLGKAMWLVSNVKAGTPTERHEVAEQLRRMMEQVNPANYTMSYETTPTRTGLGDWTGD